MKNPIKFTYFIFSSIIAYDLFFPLSSNAQNAGPEEGWGHAPRPENVPTDLEAILLTIANYALGFVALIATLVIIYGGILYLTSMGNDDRRAQGLKTISAGIIGLFIVGLAYALVTAVVSILNQG